MVSACRREEWRVSDGSSRQLFNIFKQAHFKGTVGPICRTSWGEVRTSQVVFVATQLCVFNKTSAHLETPASMMLFPTLNECFLGLNPDLTQHKHSVVTKLNEKNGKFQHVNGAEMSNIYSCDWLFLFPLSSLSTASGLIQRILYLRHRLIYLLKNHIVPVRPPGAAIKPEPTSLVLVWGPGSIGFLPHFPNFKEKGRWIIFNYGVH